MGGGNRYGRGMKWGLGGWICRDWRDVNFGGWGGCGINVEMKMGGGRDV